MKASFIEGLCIHSKQGRDFFGPDGSADGGPDKQVQTAENRMPESESCRPNTFHPRGKINKHVHAWPAVNFAERAGNDAVTLDPNFASDTRPAN